MAFTNPKWITINGQLGMDWDCEPGDIGPTVGSVFIPAGALPDRRKLYSIAPCDTCIASGIGNECTDFSCDCCVQVVHMEMTAHWARQPIEGQPNQYANDHTLLHPDSLELLQQAGVVKIPVSEPVYFPQLPQLKPQVRMRT